MTDNIRINLPPDSIHEPTNPSPAEGLRRLADNTPLNADDELRQIILKGFDMKGYEWDDFFHYGEREYLLKAITDHTKNHELQARIDGISYVSNKYCDELGDHAGTELDEELVRLRKEL